MGRRTTGRGEAQGHHGELLQGVFDDGAARLHRGLVTLPYPHLRSTAVFEAGASHSVAVEPPDCDKAKRAAALAIARFSPQALGGLLSISSNIPVGRGMGSSTADVIASIRAILDYLMIEAGPDIIMRIAIEAETACDSTLFNQQAVLFAHREGVVMEAFSRTLPAIDLVSIDAAPDQVVDTLDFRPARYESAEIETFRVLRGLLRRAVRDRDVNLLGRIATASARINERFLPKPRFDAILSVAAQYGAAGVQVAHSGTVVGMMFDPSAPGAAPRVQGAIAALRDLKFQVAEPGR